MTTKRTLSEVLTGQDLLSLQLDEMHLTPFHGVVQLRPSFKYLDKIDEKHRQANKKVSDEENKEILAKQKAELEQKAKALQVHSHCSKWHYLIEESTGFR